MTRVWFRGSARAALLFVFVMFAVACTSGADSDSGSRPTSVQPVPIVELDADGATITPPTADADGGDEREVDPPSIEPVVDDAESSPAEEPRYTTELSDVLYDPDVVHTFEINLDPDKLAEIDADPVAERYVEGSLTFAEETVGPIGIRYKGALGAFLTCTDQPQPVAPSGAKTCTKLSMKLKMNWQNSDDTFYGVKKVQLHSQNSDATLMHERLGYWLFREMGVPAPRSTHARVLVNGEVLGVFALTEQIDGRFTRQNFDDGSGNLYKEVWPFDAEGVPRTADAFIDGLKTNEDEDPTAELVASFAAELATAEPGTEMETIERWVDVDLFLRTMVVDRAIKHDDGPLNANCFVTCDRHNFYWYENPTTGKLTLIPWDLDNAFINLVSSDRPESAAALADRFGDITADCELFLFGVFSLPQKSAACDPLIGPISKLTDEFDAIRAELVAGPYSKDSVDERIATWSAQIQDLVAAVEQAHDDGLPVAAWNGATDLLISDIDIARETDGR